MQRLWLLSGAVVPRKLIPDIVRVPGNCHRTIPEQVPTMCPSSLLSHLASRISSSPMGLQSWLTNRHAITMHSSAQRRRLTARLPRGVELACSVLTKNSIGEAIAYATATRLHLSVFITAPPSRRQPGQPISSAECLTHGAAHASHRAAPCPVTPRPAFNVHVGAPSVAPSAHANRAVPLER